MNANGQYQFRSDWNTVMAWFSKRPHLQLLFAAVPFVWLGTLWQRFGLVMLVNYVAAAFLGVVIVVLTGDVIPYKVVNKLSVIAAALVAVSLNAYFDRYTIIENESDSVFRQSTCTRWSWRPYYVKRWNEWKENEIHWSVEGYVTPSGKRHGKWSIFEFGKGHPAIYQDVWYWYGDEVSEGEFVLRSAGRRGS